MTAAALPKPGTPLTARQREVLALTAEGLSNEDIGRRLHICEDAVKTHLYRIGRALGCRGRAAIIHRAWATGALGDRVALKSEVALLRRELMLLLEVPLS